MHRRQLRNLEGANQGIPDSENLLLSGKFMNYGWAPEPIK